MKERDEIKALIKKNFSREWRDRVERSLSQFRGPFAALMDTDMDNDGLASPTGEAVLSTQSPPSKVTLESRNKAATIAIGDVKRFRLKVASECHRFVDY
jgi:hypothetical protein